MVDDMTDTTGPTLSERARYLAGFKGDKNVLGDVPASLLTDLAAALDAQAALVKELAEALEGVVRVADRKTNEFDAARAALTKYKARAAGMSSGQSR